MPPEDRILNVAVTSDAVEYKPGQKAKLTIKVTEKNGEPFVVRIANIQRLTSALEANGTRVLKTLAHEFWDINRFPARALRNAAMRYNYLYFLFGLPRFGCMGNVIIAEKQAAS